MNTPAPRKLAANPNYYVALMFLALLLNYLDRSILSVLLVPLKPALHLSDTDIGLLTGFAFVLVYAVLGLPLARIADRAGRHHIVGIGILIWSVATIACGAVTSVPGLVAARMGVGVGEAAGTAPSLSLVSDQFPKHRRPFILAIVNAGGALGTALGLALGGLIAQYYGWRWAFVFAGVPGLILGFVIYRTLDDRRLGSVEDGAAAHQAMPSVGATATFVLRQWSIILTLIGSIFTGGMVTVISSWTPMFFSRVHHLELAQIGVTLGIIKGVAGFVGALGGGVVTSTLARRDDRWQSLSPALACFATVPAYLLFIQAHTPAMAFAALGAGVFFISSALGPVFSIYQCTSLPRLRSQVSSLHILVASLGIGGGPLLVGYLNDKVFSASGPLALQSSLVVVPVAGVLAGLCYSLATLFITRDVARVEAWSAGGAGGHASPVLH
jgi:predicted MFS family arabinose efflux permease